MDLIPRFYNEHLDQMTGVERVARTFELFDGVVAMIEHQIRRDDPNVSERELRLRTSENLYLNDEGAQRLLRMARDHGPA